MRSSGRPIGTRVAGCAAASSGAGASGMSLTPARRPPAEGWSVYGALPRACSRTEARRLPRSRRATEP
jgi:hypothetical protein